MTTSNNNTIYTQLKEVIDRGSEEEMRNFFVTHIDEFPPSTQEKIAGAFLEEQLDAIASDAAVVNDFNKEGLKMIQELEGDKRMIEDQVKITDIQEKLAS